MIETGKILQQRYRIDKQIGQGGMGAVYVATDERFGSVVAIKETLLMDDSYRKAIEREARLLNSLKHTALPRVTDHFLEEEGQFLVMEFIPGEDLGHAIERDAKPFPVEKVLNWADQLLDALDFLHTQATPVIHRDIKPQNLKLTPKGQIILLDFGLAKGNPTDAGHQTAAKSIFGYSRNYASLEQIQGTGTDPRSDLYSLSATLYHLLTGVPPEDALTRAMAVLSGQPDPLVPANRLREEIPAGVAGILYRTMDLNAALRPSSAAEMRVMLREQEKYADLVSSVPVPASKTISDLSTERTQILPGDTRHDGGKLTDVKTAVYPGNVSEETKVKLTAAGFVDTGQNKSGKRARTAPGKLFGRGVLAALAAILLMGVGALCVYVYDPTLFGAQRPAEVQDDKPAGAIPNTNTERMANASNSSAADAGAGAADEGVSAERVKAPATTETKPETGKGPKSTKPKPTDEPVSGEPGEVYVGNVKIRNGRVETPNVIVDENGVVQRIPPNPALPTWNRQQLRNMTPEQRRRMRIYLRNHNQPYPTPPQP
jgi:serine/threonine protein kinase